ncbi:hypothetical protein MMC25_000349 [Agyrium rufum]|nr:hypothetical protein [Agyrium rufum]
MTTATGLTEEQTKRRDVPFYNPKLTNLTPSARELMENYSKVPANQVESHIMNIAPPMQRERAFDIWPYPCIGGFRFLDLSISLAPLYPSVVARLRDSAKTMEPQRLLDLGCCFAQDLRKLAYDGCPGENLYACDLRPDFIDLGFDLFRDKDSLKAHFMTGNVFEEGGALGELEGTIDVLYAASFFHLFNYEEEVAVAKRVVKLLKPVKGSVLFGRQRGNIKPGTYPHRTNASGTMYRHDASTWKQMWKEVGEATGTEWDVRAELNHGSEGQRNDSLMGSDDRNLYFEVERVK